MTEDLSNIGESGLAAAAAAGSLYVVATPIGHLSDLGMRAADILRTVDVVAAEDTRSSRVLLEHIGSRARTLSAHRHNEREVAERIVGLLAQGRSVALVSDAGTPAISDPGARIVAIVRAAGHRVVPIPGPSAPIALLSACGLVEGPFHFEGFLPARAAARDARLSVLARMPHAVVLFEAPHRIARSLPAVVKAVGDSRWIALGRELSKRFEEIEVCRAGEAVAWLDADANRTRGEYALVIAAPGYDPHGSAAAAGVGAGSGTGPGHAEAPKGEGQREHDGEASTPDLADARVDVHALLAALLEELTPSRAVKVAQRATGLPHRALYQSALRIGRR